MNQKKKVCENHLCKTEFIQHTSRQRYCCAACRRAVELKDHPKETVINGIEYFDADEYNKSITSN